MSYLHRRSRLHLFVRLSVIALSAFAVSTVSVIPLSSRAAIAAAAADSPASATQTSQAPPASLVNFPVAAELLPDKQVKGKSLTQQQAFVYKIEVLPAKQLRVFAQGHSSSQLGELTLSLYTVNGTLLSRATQKVFGDKNLEAFFYKGFVEAGTAVEPIYIEFQNTSTDSTATVSYDFTPTFGLLSDTQQGYDASDGFTKATELIAGTYKANHIGKNACAVNQYCSTDATDTFAITVKAKDHVALTITPQTKLTLTAELFDAAKTSLKDQVTLTQETATPITYDATTDGVIYLVISGDATQNYFGTYDIALAIEAGVVEPPVDPEPPVIVPEPEQPNIVDQIMNWVQENLTIVGGGAVGLLVLIVILTLLMRRRKKKKLLRAAAAQAQPGSDMPQMIMPKNTANGTSVRQSVQSAAPSRRPMTRTPEAPRDPNAQTALNPTDFSLPEEEIAQQAPPAQPTQSAQPPVPPTPPQKQI